MKPFRTFVFFIQFTLCLTVNGEEFDLFLDDAARPSDYRQKLVEIERTTHRSIVYLGMPTMGLMADLDWVIEFGWSDFWDADINATETGELECAVSGGYNASLTRTSSRRVSGSVTASNCGSFGFLMNGTVDFEYDDAVWLSEQTPRTSYALVFTFSGAQVRGGDGVVYTYSGQMKCDRATINIPNIRLKDISTVAILKPLNSIMAYPAIRRIPIGFLMNLPEMPMVEFHPHRFLNIQIVIFQTSLSQAMASNIRFTD